MTEEEWLATTADPPVLLEFLGMRYGERKPRLFAAGCCRRIWHLLVDNRSREAVEATEYGPDRPAAIREAAATASAAADQAFREAIAAAGLNEYGIVTAFDGRTARFAALRYAASAAEDALLGSDAEDFGAETGVRCAMASDKAAERSASSGSTNSLSAWDQDCAEEARWQCLIIRDIFGNPFRPVPISHSWRTSTTTNLAQTIYQDRRLPSGLFDNQRLAVLADALEEAGCDNADILGHLRGGGDHVRGCWAIDQILGKE